jgi:hypothetical protein
VYPVRAGTIQRCGGEVPSDVVGDSGQSSLDVTGLHIAVVGRPRRCGAQAGVGQEDQVAEERILHAVLHRLPQPGVLIVQLLQQLLLVAADLGCLAKRSP